MPSIPRITERYEIRRALKGVESCKDTLQTPLCSFSGRRAGEEDTRKVQYRTKVQERALGGHLTEGHYHIAPVRSDVQRAQPAQTSPHSRSLQTRGRHKSDTVPQPVAVASCAFAPTPDGSLRPQANTHAMPRHDSKLLGRAGDTALF